MHCLLGFVIIMKCEQRRLSFEVGVNVDYVSILVQTTLQLFNPSNELIQQQSFISKKGISNKMDSITTYCKLVDIFYKSLIVGLLLDGMFYNKTKCLMLVGTFLLELHCLLIAVAKMYDCT